MIEVVSPGSAIYDRNAKADTYGALSVKELWLIEDARVEVRNQVGDGFGAGRAFTGQDRIISAVLPDLELSVAQLFAD